MIGAVERVAAFGAVEFDHRGATITRMQLNAVERIVTHDVRDGDAEPFRVPLASLDIIAIEDCHIAADAAGAIEKAPGRRAVARRRDHFEKRMAEWK